MTHERPTPERLGAFFGRRVRSDHHNLRPEPLFAYPRPEPPGAPRGESSLMDK